MATQINRFFAMYEVNHLKANPRISSVTIFSFFGLFLAFIGLCITQGGMTSTRSFNDIGLQWFYLFLYAVWFKMMIVVIGTNTLRTYRSLLTSLTVLVLMAVPSDMDKALFWVSQTLSGSSIAIGNQIRFVGLLFFIFPVIIVLVLLGSEDDAIVHSIELPTLPTSREHEVGPRLSQGGRNADANRSNAVDSNVGMQQELPFRATSQATVYGGPERVALYRARALYDYTATPADPNEISFKQGTVFEVMDDRGKWWFVTKLESGESGLAPANYLEVLH